MGRGGHGDICSHDHDCGAENCGSSSLHPYIIHPQIMVMNAEEDEAAQRIFRPWEERMNREGSPLRSDGDPELIIHVPFISDVHVRGIMIVGGAKG